MAFFVPEQVISVAAAGGFQALPAGLSRILNLLLEQGQVRQLHVEEPVDGLQAVTNMLSSAALSAWSVLDMAVHWLAYEAMSDSSNLGPRGEDGAVGGDGGLPCLPLPAMRAVWAIPSIADPALQQLRAAAANAWAHGMPLVLASRPPPPSGSGTSSSALLANLFASDAAQGSSQQLALCCASSWVPFPGGAASTLQAEPETDRQLQQWAHAQDQPLLPGSRVPSAELLALAVVLQRGGEASLRQHPQCGPVLLPPAASADAEAVLLTAAQPMLQHLTARCMCFVLQHRRLAAASAADVADSEARAAMRGGRRASAKHALVKAAHLRRRCGVLYGAEAKLLGVLHAIDQAQDNSMLLQGMAGATHSLSWHNAQSNSMLQAGVVDELHVALQDAREVQAQLGGGLEEGASEEDIDASMADLEAELQSDAATATSNLHQGAAGSCGALPSPHRGPEEMPSLPWDQPSPPQEAHGAGESPKQVQAGAYA